jgi:hypothetical protein
MRAARGISFLAAACVVAVGLAIALLVLSRGGEKSTAPSTAQLAAKNYRTLSARESRRLLAFAQSEYNCLAGRGAKISRPVASPTRIVMQTVHQTARQIADLSLACEGEVGKPPPGASLQARPGQLLVYVPKWCLLDPSEQSRFGSTQTA